jgi:3-oxoacyl-[acyl-carrier-protein] synthase-3
MYPEWTVDKISTKIGVDSRHISGDDETSGDLAFAAAQNLFAAHGVDPDTIDYVVLCTQSPDYFLPSTACILQHKLGLSKNAGAFDYNLGCSGYVYGLGLAKGLICSGQASSVLLLTGETYTKYINPRDKGNKTLFGDAGTATLISSEKVAGGINAEIMDFCYGTDGSQADTLIVSNGCMRHRACDGRDQQSEDGEFVRNDNNLFMDGKAIFNFTSFQVPTLIARVLEKNALSLADIDEFVFHQANEFMLETVRKRCGIDKDKFYMNIRTLGNTVSNTIPIALNDVFEAGGLNNKRRVLLAGFGVGLSMGAVVLNLQ